MSENTTSHQPTLLPADSLASLTVSPGSEKAHQMTATSGRNLAGLLPSFDPATFLLRMFLESSPPISTRCYLTWRVKATPARRLIFQLAPSMPRIGERESLWLPTPQAMDASGGKGRMNTNANTTQWGGVNSLSGMAATGMWPTMRSGDGIKNKLRKREAIIRSGGHRGRLEDAVAMWTTPTKGDTCHRKNKYAQGGTALSTQAGGRLNPTWTEWLMGLPLNWTEIDSAPSETP